MASPASRTLGALFAASILIGPSVAHGQVTNDFLERATVSKFGSLGADGLQGPAVILGHSDLAKRAVFDLILDAAMAARKWPRPPR